MRVAPGVTAGELSGWTDAHQVTHVTKSMSCAVLVFAVQDGQSLAALDNDTSCWWQTELNYSSLPVITVYPRNRLSGVVAMGSHGKATGFGALADQVHSLKIVNGAGTVVEYDASHPQFNDAK